MLYSKILKANVLTEWSLCLHTQDITDLEIPQVYSFDVFSLPIFVFKNIKNNDLVHFFNLLIQYTFNSWLQFPKKEDHQNKRIYLKREL